MISQGSISSFLKRDTKNPEDIFKDRWEKCNILSENGYRETSFSQAQKQTYISL